MEELFKPFYGVMHKYQKHFGEPGVRRNLELWSANKGGLVSMLSRHPNWNPEALAVISDIVERREIVRTAVKTERDALVSIAHEQQMTGDTQLRFVQALDAAVSDLSVTPSEQSIERIKERGGINCVSGQKTSRIINRLCSQFGVDKHARYNAVFAKLSDALNPAEVRRKAVLSVHPCDYLEMSGKHNTWSSCHCLADGGYKGGCLSYLTDSVTMIFYTTDEEVDSDYHKALKRSRQIFCFDRNKLLQSRLYPNCGDVEAKKLYRAHVQEVVAACILSWE